jgi:pimeloyl-ACP methyl ester carboxylesterase
VSAGAGGRIFEGDGNIRLAADVAGDPLQPAVVLLHGGGQTRHSWSGAFQALARAGYYTVNIDARGHGESEWSADGRYSVEARS